MISTLAANDNIAFVGHDHTHAPDGYYLARALGPAYELEADTDLAELLDENGKPTHLPKGSRVVELRSGRFPRVRSYAPERRNGHSAG